MVPLREQARCLQGRQCRVRPSRAFKVACSAKAQKNAIVIGGGIGGLVTAGRLAREGMSVTLLEKNSEVGGRCQSIDRNGYRFDTGPSLLLFPDNYREAYESLGTTLEEQVELKRVEPTGYRVFLGDGTKIDMMYDVQKMIKQLEGIEKGSGLQYLRWLGDARAALEEGLANFIERDFDGVNDYLDPERLLKMISKVDPIELLGQHHGRLARRFKDPRLQAFFSFQDLYVGLSPYNAPGVYSLLGACDITEGIWYPTGGFGQIRDTLRKQLESLGVSIRTEVGVTGIRVNGDKARGVNLADGSSLAADVVVSNVDVPLSYGLINSNYAQQKQKQITNQEYSCGIIAFNWSVNTKLDTLAHHSIFLSDEYQKAWQRARTPQELVRWPNFYVHSPCRTDPSAAPDGCDSIMVLLPVANMQESGTSEYQALVDAGRESILRVFKEAGVGDIRGNIQDELVITPPQWKQRYGIEHGAVFGLSHGMLQLALLRPAIREERIKGLYMVGASARPGNGVPLVMIGTKLAHQRVMEDVAAGVV